MTTRTAVVAGTEGVVVGVLAAMAFQRRAASLRAWSGYPDCTKQHGPGIKPSISACSICSTR